MAIQFCEPTNNSITGWNSHTNGVTRLMLIRGPERYRSSFGRALLEGIRLSAVCTTKTGTDPGLTILSR